jgi:hypothetical protein
MEGSNHSLNFNLLLIYPVMQFQSVSAVPKYLRFENIFKAYLSYLYVTVYEY